MFVLLLLAGVLLTLIGRLYHIQILQHSKLQARARAQHLARIRYEPKRGTIYDRNGRELAISIKVNSAYAIPARLKSKEKTARRISAILGLGYRDILKGLTSGRSFCWLKRKISPSEAETIKGLGLPGIRLLAEWKRFYPKGSLACQVIGFVGMDNQGLEGVELYYDEEFRGEQSLFTFQRDARGYHIWGAKHPKSSEQNERPILPVASRQRRVEGQTFDGCDLNLTIDEVIQHIAQRELNRAVDQYRAKSGIIIVMVPETGEILAMANWPTYNPNDFENYSPGTFRNRAITDTFEPGSVLKVVTAAAALEDGVVGPDDRFYCEEGAFKLFNHTIHDVKDHGWLTFREIIEVSSNIGVVKVGQQVGKEKLYRCLRKCGFNTLTGIDLPGEVRGVLQRPDQWSRLSMGSIPIGQEISVTGIQLISAISAMANGGLLMRPWIVKEISDSKGRVLKGFNPVVVRRVVSTETSKIMTNILKGVVDRGTGKLARIPGYQVAGKTGTAQKPDSTSGGYSKDRFIAVFAGWVPADSPQLAILVVIDEPQGVVHHGGLIAAPVFRRVALDALRYLNVPPLQSAFDEATSDQEQTSDQRSGRPCRAATFQAGTPRFIGEAAGKTMMPDLLGLTMRDASRILSGYRLKPFFEGSGIAIRQSPTPGTEITPGDECFLQFKPPISDRSGTVKGLFE